LFGFVSQENIATCSFQELFISFLDLYHFRLGYLDPDSNLVLMDPDCNDSYSMIQKNVMKKSNTSTFLEKKGLFIGVYVSFVNIYSFKNFAIISYFNNWKNYTIKWNKIL